MTTFLPAPSPAARSALPRDAIVGELFDEHAGGLYRLARAMLHEPDAAQDVVQDTFVKLIAHLDGGGALPNARGWLYTVAAHACRDRQRGRSRWLPWIAERDVRPANDGPDRRDGADAVLAAIRGLAARSLAGPVAGAGTFLPGDRGCGANPRHLSRAASRAGVEAPRGPPERERGPARRALTAGATKNGDERCHGA